MMHGVTQLADVRTMPMSRRPAFQQGFPGSFLAASGIRYRHFADSVAQEAETRLHQYGMEATELSRLCGLHGDGCIRTSVRELVVFASAGPTAVMCAEAVWWRCHRRLLADALLVQGEPVWHIVGASAKPHEMSEFARIREGRSSIRRCCSLQGSTAQRSHRSLVRRANFHGQHFAALQEPKPPFQCLTSSWRSDCIRAGDGRCGMAVPAGIAH